MELVFIELGAANPDKVGPDNADYARPSRFSSGPLGRGTRNQISNMR
jgi:hypothetical protein